MTGLRLARRLMLTLVLLGAAAVVGFVLLVLVVFGIGAYQAHANTAALRGLIDRSLPQRVTLPRTLAFLHTHQTVALLFGRFDIGADLPFEHERAYISWDETSQVYPRGSALVASGEDDRGDDLVIVFFFDSTGCLLRDTVDETWFHAPWVDEWC